MIFFRTCKDGFHKFEARYSYGKPATIEVSNSSYEAVVQALEASKPKTYIYDICVKCGKIVKE